MKWQILVSRREVVIDHPPVPSCVCVVHPPTGNRDALRKRAHYRSYAAGYNFIHEERSISLARAFTFSRRFFHRGEPGSDPLGFLYFLPSSSLLPSPSFRSLSREDERTIRRRAVALALAIVTSEKSRRGQKAWII